MIITYKDFVIDYTRSIDEITDIIIKKDLNEHSKLYIKGIIPTSEKENALLK